MYVYWYAVYIYDEDDCYDNMTCMHIFSMHK